MWNESTAWSWSGAHAADAVRDVGGKAKDGKEKFGKYGKGKKGKGKSKHDQSNMNPSPSGSRYFDGECGYFKKWRSQTSGLSQAQQRRVQRQGTVHPILFNLRTHNCVTHVQLISLTLTLMTCPGSLCSLVGVTTFSVVAERWSLLVDSGSDEHVCRRTFPPHVEPIQVGPSHKLFDAQQQPLASQGASVCSCLKV